MSEPEGSADEATPFENVEIGDELPPAQDETLPEDEKLAIAQERDEIITSNGGRGADEQISVDPLEVN